MKEIKRFIAQNIGNESLLSLFKQQAHTKYREEEYQLIVKALSYLQAMPAPIFKK